MTTTKEHYWKYSLIVLILLLGALIVAKLWMFVNGLLGAFTIFVLVRRQMIYLTEKAGIKKQLAAAAILLETAACIIVPVYFLTWVLLGKVQGVNIDISALMQTVRHFDELVREKLGYTLLNADIVNTATGYLTKGVQVLISQVSGLFVTTLTIIFLLYFMLVEHREIERYVYDLLPFNDTNRRNVASEIYRLVRSNAIGIPLLALIQGMIAYIGYLIFGVPSAFLTAVLTCFATIVPLVGTGIVWVPVVTYMALTGNWTGAIGLTAYCSIILINIDNFIRFILQKKLADTHPLITVFGVIFGIAVFGFWGVVFGPLLLSLFFLMISILKHEYLEENR
ncbi:MAG: AI-2E family transporter [Tannerella sp.]|jgi:predicted PurR-regulated permease PerM|nr:AI-2E family transporter [Tannerella sp.]